MNSSPITDAALDGLIERLAGATTETDQAGTWPSEQLGWFAESGVFRWVIPAEFGGLELSPAEIVRGYERLAEGCLTSTFILTQRNGACQRIAGCDNDELKSDVLPGLAEGRLFATVGISHLTTSRQHVRTPPVRVRLRGDIVELDGEVPWVTGARPADFIVTGGACDDRRQVLIAVPTQLPGVEPHEPARLLALTGSQTGSVRLQNVTLSRQHVLAGPVENVMRTGEGGGGIRRDLSTGGRPGALRNRLPEGRGHSASGPDHDCRAIPTGTGDAPSGSALHEWHFPRSGNARESGITPSSREFLLSEGHTGHVGGIEGGGLRRGAPCRTGSPRSHVLSRLVVSSAGADGRSQAVRLSGGLTNALRPVGDVCHRGRDRRVAAQQVTSLR